MTCPDISIVMPVYNAETRLQAALDSIYQQTLTGWELVAVDDGSSDLSARILEDAARVDKRVRVLRRSHYGIASALNAGARAAKAEWLCRMDSDDVMLEHRLATQLEFARSHPELAVVGGLVAFRCEGELAEESGMLRFVEWVNSLVRPEDIAREIFIDCPIPHPTFLMRRSTLMDCGGYSEAGDPEDYELLLRLNAAGHALGKVPETILVWTDYAGRASRILPEYAASVFRRLKIRYLAKTIDGRPLYQWGAGSVGKRFMRELAASGAQLRALIDVDPRKIGQRIHGTPVIPAEALLAERPEDALVLVAVGAPGARDDIRAYFSRAGLEEARDFLFVA